MHAAPHGRGRAVAGVLRDSERRVQEASVGEGEGGGEEKEVDPAKFLPFCICFTALLVLCFANNAGHITEGVLRDSSAYLVFTFYSVTGGEREIVPALVYRFLHLFYYPFRTFLFCVSFSLVVSHTRTQPTIDEEISFAL